MAFTFTDYAGMETPKSRSSMILSKALESYEKSMDLSNKKTSNQYLPEQIQSEIFSKEISPLAQLAASPTFKGFSPQVQKMIADRIENHLSHYFVGQQGSPKSKGESTTGYSTGKNIYDRIVEHSGVYNPGGQLKAAGSRLAGEAKTWGIPDAITKIFGGEKSANEKAYLDQDLSEAKRNLDLQGYSKEVINSIDRKTGESTPSWHKRIKPLLVESNAQEKNSSNENSSEMENNNDDLRFALSLSQDIKERTGHDVPENIIVNYMQKNPGKINIPKLLKSAGIK